MEVWFQDEKSLLMCSGKKEQIVDLVHEHLGRASLVKITSLNDGRLELRIATGAIVVNNAFKRIPELVN